MKTLLLALFLLIIGLVVNGQNKIENESKKVFNPDEIQENWVIFRKALETTYPSLYRFTDSLNITTVDDY